MMTIGQSSMMIQSTRVVQKVNYRRFSSSIGAEMIDWEGIVKCVALTFVTE
jgi:hypothetical protein